MSAHREIADMAALIAWIAIAMSGEVAVYHRGDLSIDRRRQRGHERTQAQRAYRLDRLAKAMIALAAAGCVHLTRARLERDADGWVRFEYRATAALMPAQRQHRLRGLWLQLVPGVAAVPVDSEPAREITQ